MAGSEGGNDFFLNFGSDAAPFSRQIANDLNPGIQKIEALSKALAQYEAQAAKSKTGSSPLGLTFQNLDAAAERIENATKGFSTQFNSIVERITGVASQLDAAMRLVNRAGAQGGARRGERLPPPAITRPANAPRDPNENIVPVTGTRPVNRQGRDSADYLARLAALQRQDSEKAAAKARTAGVATVSAAEAEAANVARTRTKKTSETVDSLTAVNTKLGKTVSSLGDHLAQLDAQLKAMLKTGTTTAKKRSPSTEGDEDSRRVNNATAEVQVGNTPSNPIPVVIVGGDPSAVGGHGHPGPHHTPVARTATADSQAKAEVAAVTDVINAAPGTRKNPRPLAPGERPYTSNEYVYPLGGDPKKDAIRPYGMRANETFGDYSARVGGVQGRVGGALNGLPALSKEDQDALYAYRQSGGRIPKQSPAVLREDHTGSLTAALTPRATPPDVPANIRAILARRDEVFRQRANGAQYAIGQELLQDPHMTQDGLHPDAKAALSRFDKLIDEPGLGTLELPEARGRLNALLGQRHNFSDDQVTQFIAGAANRNEIRSRGRDAFQTFRDNQESDQVLYGKHRVGDLGKGNRHLLSGGAYQEAEWTAEEAARQGEINAQRNSAAGRDAARQASVKNAGARLRNAQGFIERVSDPNFNDKSVPEVDKAERSLRAALAPVVGGLRDQLTRVRKPERIAEIKASLEALTLKTKTPSELALAEASNTHAAALKEFNNLKGMPNPNPKELAAVEAAKNEAEARKNELKKTVQPYSTSARRDELLRVAQNLAAMHAEALENAVAIPRAQTPTESGSKSEPPAVTPTATAETKRRRSARSTATNTKAASAQGASEWDDFDWASVESSDHYMRFAGSGGGGKPPRPPRPPAPPAGADDPDDYDRQLAAHQAKLKRALGRTLGGVGGIIDAVGGSSSEPEPIPYNDRAINSDLQKRIAALHPDTQAALATARQSILAGGTAAEQRGHLVDAAVAFKSDPAMASIFKTAADRGRSFGETVGLDVRRRGVRGLIREDIFPDADQRVRAGRLGNSALSSGAGENATAEARVRLDELLSQASGHVKDARIAEFIAEERLRAVRASSTTSIMEEARAEMQLAAASRNRAVAEQAAFRQDQVANGGSYQRLTGKTNSFGKDLIRHGANALENTIGYTLVFTGFEKLREVVHTGIEADAAFVRLKASLDANGISAGNLTGKLAEISATTATPLEHVIEAASELAGTFKSAGDIAFATNIASQLANISQGALTAKEAAVGLRDVVAAFGQGWVSSSTVARRSIQETGDQIAHLSQLTGVSVKDITEGTTQIAQEAHDFGLNQRQSATLAAYVTQGTGQTGEQAASQTSRMLSTLYNGKTQAALVRIGVASQQDFQSGNIGKVLTNLISKYNTLNDSSKQSIAALMGTGIQARAFAALMNGGANAVKELNGQMNDTGALARQNQAYLNTVAGSIKQLSEDFQNLGSTLAHLGAFDAIGLLANALDKLFKEFNKVFGGLANLLNSNPVTQTLLHYTAVILEAAAAWRIFGAAATTALVRSGAVSAAGLGVGVRNADEIAQANAAREAGIVATALPAAKYERAGVAALAGGLAQSGRARLVGMLPAGRANATAEAQARAQARVAETATVLADAERNLTALKERETVATTEVIAAMEAVTAASTANAEAQTAAAETGGARTGSNFFTGGATTGGLLKLGGLAVAGGILIGGGIANKHFKSQNAADDAIFGGSTDPGVFDKTTTPTGTNGFFDQYFGKGNFFQHTGNAIEHTFQGAVGLFNPVNFGHAAGDLFTGHFGNLASDFGRGFSGGSSGPSDQSNKEFLNLNSKVWNQGVVKNLPKLKTEADVNAWLKEESDAISKHAKEIEKAGGNDKNAQAQIAFSINRLQQTLTDAATRRIAAINGLRQIDVLNSQQAALITSASSQFAGFNKDTLRTQGTAIGQILDATGAPQGSSEYTGLRAATDPNATHAQRLQSQIGVDQATLKSVVASLDTVGKPGGLDPTSQTYQQDVQSRDQLLTQIQAAKQQLLQEGAQNAQGFAQLNVGTGNDAGAVSQMKTAITKLQGLNNNLDATDPQFVANLQAIQQLKVQIAQTAIIPQLDKLSLTAAGSNDPLVQAKANYQAALVTLDAANKQYQAEYNAEVQAVAAAQKQLDDYIKSWDGHARTDQLAIITQLEAALGSAKSNVNTTGTDPFKQAAQVAAEQQNIAEQNAQEQLTEAQYTASIAGIRNATAQAQAQLTGVLQQESRYSYGSLASDQKLAELKGQEAQIRIQIRDAIEADKESVYGVTAATQKVQGNDVGAAQTELNKANQSYRYALQQYGRSSKQANDALAAVISAQAAVQDAMLAQINSSLDLQIAQLTSRGQAGDIYKAAQFKIQEAQNALQEYLKKGGSKGTATYNQLLGAVSTAQRSAFDQQLQDQLDLLDFQRETYAITSSQEVQSLQLILKNKQLTLQEQRDVTLKIKNLQESIRQQLTQGGLNIPTGIVLPTAYEVRRSMGGGFGGSSTQVNTVNNNQQVTINNNVPNAQIAAQIANEVINQINQQTSMGLRSSSSTPRTVPTR